MRPTTVVASVSVALAAVACALWATPLDVSSLWRAAPQWLSASGVVPATATPTHRADGGGIVPGASWLTAEQRRVASWRPRRDSWPPINTTLPAGVEELHWSPRPEWRRSLLRRAYPALIRGSPVRMWDALHRWKHPHTADAVCSATDTLPNTLSATSDATPSDTFFYLNPNAPMIQVRDSKYLGHQFYAQRNMSCRLFFDKVDQGRPMYYSNDVASTSLRLLHDLQPLLPFDDSSKYRMNAWFAGAGAKSRMHFDSSHNLFVQLVGHKRFVLVSPEQWDELRMYPRLHPASRQSQLDVEREGNAALNVRTVVLGPGDMLFLPAMYFHQVVALDKSVSINMYHTPEWRELLPRIFKSWPSFPSFRGLPPEEVDPCVIRDLVRYCAEVVRLGVIKLPTLDPAEIQKGVQAFFATIYHTRYSTLARDPIFGAGDVFVHGALDHDLAAACDLVSRPLQAKQQCGDSGVDWVAAAEIARVVALWLRRVPAGMRAMLASDYVEQAVYRVIGARHVGSFFRTCVQGFA